MKENVKVAIWGFGAMGKGMAEMLLKKTGVEITAVCDRNPQRVGKDMYEYLGINNSEKKVIITDNHERAFPCGIADIMLLATDSFTKDAYDKIIFSLDRGMNVISTAEEMAYPKAQEPELATKINKYAEKAGLTVLGTGINPGLIMDLLVVCLSGCMVEVEEVFAERVNSLSPFGKTVMEEQGVGMELDKFNAKVKDGTMAGHVGFAESVGMISDAIGWKVDKFEQQMKAIVTDEDRKSPHGFAAAGNVAGVNMTAQGYVDGKKKIVMSHPQQIEPEQVGVYTGDYINLKGTPPVNMEIKPEVEGGLGTIAMCVNMIPHVINSHAGLVTMLDLPVPRAIMGDMRMLIKE